MGIFDFFNKRKQNNQEAKELEKQVRKEKDFKKQEIINNFTNKFSGAYNRDQLKGLIDGEINILERGLGANKRVPIKRLSYVFKSPKKFDNYMKGYNDIYDKHRKAVDNQLKFQVMKEKFNKDFDIQQNQQMEQKQKFDEQNQEQINKVKENSEKRIQEQQQKLEDRKNELEEIRQNNEIKQQQKQQFLEEQKQIKEKYQQELEEVKKQEQERLEQLKEQEEELVEQEVNKNEQQEELEEQQDSAEEERIIDLEEFHEQVELEENTPDYDEFEHK